MFGNPKNLNECCDAFLRDVKGIWGDGITSVILYGSAAGEGYSPKRSDVNFLVVAEDLNPETLRRLHPLTRGWRRRRIATPLIMRKSLIETSLDSYPLEFLSMMVSYRVLYGEDVLQGLEFRKEDVRLQCERELKAKLLLLREAYVDSSGVKLLLQRLISESLPAMNAIFQGLLYLQGRPWKFVGDPLLSAGKQSFGLNIGLFQDLWRVKRKELRPGAEETHKLLAGYINEVARLAEWADRGSLMESTPVSGNADSKP
jgi:predicted nucleotidyltransferase